MPTHIRVIKTSIIFADARDYDTVRCFTQVSYGVTVSKNERTSIFFRSVGDGDTKDSDIEIYNFVIPVPSLCVPQRMF